ncbi:hypothetical protein DFH06DRAFT_1380720, partial [Mycena polygramma]
MAVHLVLRWESISRDGRRKNADSSLAVIVGCSDWLPGATRRRGNSDVAFAGANATRVAFGFGSVSVEEARSYKHSQIRKLPEIVPLKARRARFKAQESSVVLLYFTCPAAHSLCGLVELSHPIPPSLPLLPFPSLAVVPVVAAIFALILLAVTALLAVGALLAVDKPSSRCG